MHLDEKSGKIHDFNPILILKEIKEQGSVDGNFAIRYRKDGKYVDIGYMHVNGDSKGIKISLVQEKQTIREYEIEFSEGFVDKIEEKNNTL